MRKVTSLLKKPQADVGPGATLRAVKIGQNERLRERARHTIDGPGWFHCRAPMLILIIPDFI
jgi:hypothetical protein